MSNKRYVQRRTKKKKAQFADYIVFLSIFAVTAFAVAAFILQFRGMTEISTTLTAAWFAFWTAEIVALASIRNVKVKNEYNKNKNKEEDDNGND